MSDSLKVRVARAFGEQSVVGYFELMGRVWPPAEYPRAHRGATKGGPPGVAMHLGRVLRELGLRRTADNRVYANAALRALIEGLSK